MIVKFHNIININPVKYKISLYLNVVRIRSVYFVSSFIFFPLLAK
jgi:hypothetical protein